MILWCRRELPALLGVIAIFMNIGGTTWLLSQPPGPGATSVATPVEVSCCCTRGVCQVSGNCRCEKAESEQVPPSSSENENQRPDCWIIETCHFPLPGGPVQQGLSFELLWRGLPEPAASISGQPKDATAAIFQAAKQTDHLTAPPEPPPNRRIVIQINDRDSALLRV